MENRYYTARGVRSTLDQKMKQGTCKIAFLGNSVTAQKSGYVHDLQELLNTVSGQKHTYIQAGLGGIGSLATCFITDDFVSRHKPDICFIECTVADIGYATPQRYLDAAVSGIVEKLMITGTQIYFLHLYCAGIAHSNAMNTMDVYEAVANRYSIPSIYVGKSIADSIAKGILVEDDLVYDGIHTTATGAMHYANLIFEAFCAIHACEAPLPCSDPPARTTSAYRNTQIVLPPSLVHDPSASLSKARFRGFLKYITISHAYTLRYASTHGTILGFLLIADEESGVLQVDHGTESSYIQTSDAWCHKERIQAVILPAPIPATQEIQVSLSLKDSADVGANGTANPTNKIGKSFKLIGFLEVLDTEPKIKYSLW